MTKKTLPIHEWEFSQWLADFREQLTARMEPLPLVAVDLQGDGEPVNPNAGVVQAFPSGRWGSGKGQL